MSDTTEKPADRKITYDPESGKYEFPCGSPADRKITEAEAGEYLRGGDMTDFRLLMKDEFKDSCCHCVFWKAHGNAEWPETEWDDWCGDFKR